LGDSRNRLLRKDGGARAAVEARHDFLLHLAGPWWLLYFYAKLHTTWAWGNLERPPALAATMSWARNALSAEGTCETVGQGMLTSKHTHTTSSRIILVVGSDHASSSSRKICSRPKAEYKYLGLRVNR